MYGSAFGWLQVPNLVCEPVFTSPGLVFVLSVNVLSSWADSQPLASWLTGPAVPSLCLFIYLLVVYSEAVC